MFDFAIIETFWYLAAASLERNIMKSFLIFTKSCQRKVSENN